METRIHNNPVNTEDSEVQKYKKIKTNVQERQEVGTCVGTHKTAPSRCK